MKDTVNVFFVVNSQEILHDRRVWLNKSYFWQFEEALTLEKIHRVDEAVAPERVALTQIVFFELIIVADNCLLYQLVLSRKEINQRDIKSDVNVPTLVMKKGERELFCYPCCFSSTRVSGSEEEASLI